MPRRRLPLAALLIALALPLGLLAQPANGAAKPTEGRVLKELWEAAYLEGVHVGHIHRIFRELRYGERPLVEALVEMDLRLSRFDQPIALQSVIATHENAEGKLRGFIIQEGVKEQRLFRKGRVTGPELVWSTQLGSKAPSERRLPWKEAALGLYAQEQALARLIKSGAKALSFERFEPVFDTIMPATLALGEEEEVTLAGTIRRKLRKVTCALDPKLSQDAPPEFFWVDDAGEVWKRQIRLPLLGELVSYRATQELATIVTSGGPTLDLGRAQLVPLNKGLFRPQEARGATYLVHLREVDNAGNAFASDAHQTVRLVNENTVEIKVAGLRRPPLAAASVPGFGPPPAPVPPLNPAAPPSELVNSPRPPAEYLQSNAFITSADANVRRLAAQAVGAEVDPWCKAVRIESWVRRNLRGTGSTEAFAAAADVAKTLSGDCKGHAVLAAAMCRAAGVPSRIVVGLIYVPRERAFGFHMWLEVWIGGQWYGLDPTVGQGRVAADHIKVFDHSLNGEASFAPMLPIARLLGKMKLEVAEVDYAVGLGAR